MKWYNWLGLVMFVAPSLGVVVMMFWDAGWKPALRILGIVIGIVLCMGLGIWLAVQP